MTFPRLAEIEQELAHPVNDLTAFPVAFLRNVTLEGMTPYLRYAARHDGLDLEIRWGAYDNILQEALGGGSGVVGPEVGVIVVNLWLPAFSELLGLAFARATPADIAVEIERVQDYITATLRALRERSAAPILWLSFEPPAWPSYGILDPTMSQGHRKVIRDLNAHLAAELVTAGNAWLVDTAQCLERVGARQFYDWRYWYMAHSPISRAGLAELANEIGKHARALVGRTRKCLVLDCDNTLWGGIVGEDGTDGICIGAEHPGSSFREFQLEALNLYSRGVILALCSKNNMDEVLEVFRTRPEMILREEHISSMRVNWQDKATNLREIATELNIGLDSIVFADDSDFEINLVRSELPEIETIHLPVAQCTENRARLASCGLFDALALTDEDRARGQMYRAEVARKTLRAQATNMGDYLASLEMRLVIQEVGDHDLDRVAQLCLRTNQFNLTTRRHTKDELAAIASHPANSLHLLKLSDRYGDYGTIGFCMTMVRDGAAIVDTFLMSCRALGRGVETAFLAICAEAAYRKGGTVLRGCYIQTKKNALVADFYTRHGFRPIDLPDPGQWYELDWTSSRISVPEHLTVSVEETREYTEPV